MYEVQFDQEEANRVNRAIGLVRRLTTPDAKMAASELTDVVGKKLHGAGYRGKETDKWTR